MKIYAVILLLLCSLLADSQPFMFKHLEVADGLSSNHVQSICKDNEGFLWFGTLSGLNRYDGYTFKTFSSKSLTPTHTDNYVRSILEMPDGRLWVQTTQGYLIFNPSTEQFTTDLQPLMTSLGSNGLPHRVFIDSDRQTWIFVQDEGCYMLAPDGSHTAYPFRSLDMPPTGVTAIAQCQDGIVFVYDNGLIICLDTARREISWQTNYIQSQIDGKTDDFSLFVDKENCIWIYSYLGIWVYDLPVRYWQLTTANYWNGTSDFIHSIAQDQEGRIWVAKDQSGIDILDKKNHTVCSLRAEDDPERGISHNSVLRLYSDRDGIMWAGTYKKGICYYSEATYKFGIDKLGDITSVEPAGRNRAWLGTVDRGVVLWDYDNRLAVKSLEISRSAVVSLLATKDGTLFVGTFNDGLYIVSPSGRVRHTKAEDGKIPSNNIWTMTEEADGNVLIGYLDAGIQRYVVSSNSFETLDVIASGMTDYHVVSLTLTKSGDIVVGCSDSGVWILDKHTRRVKKHIDMTGRNGVNHVFRDSRDLVWIASRLGVDYYNPSTDELVCADDLLPVGCDNISAITEDESHDIWLTSARQMIHLSATQVASTTTGRGNVYRFSPRTYTEKDGLQNADFNLRALTTLESGLVVAGGLYGVNCFHPQSISYNRLLPRVLFTGVSVFGRGVAVGEELNGRVLLTEGLNKSRQLTLKHKENIFSVSLASDNMLLPEKTHYSYCLEGFQDEWLTLPDGIHSVTFTNLAPGDYTLSVRAINSDNFEGSDVANLRITILPPFYQTWWAYLLDLLALCIVVAFVRQRLIANANEKYRIHQIEIEAAKQEELNNLKFRFFTSISHELRTPLTLIMTPLEEMISKNKDDDNKHYLELMYRNANRLLLLVNQILDFRKGEMDSHRLVLSEGDVVSYVRNVCDTFLLMADKKKIQFSFYSALDSFPMAFDTDKMGKIIVNLLANALRFTPEGGRVGVMIDHIDDESNLLEIKVTDTGIGVRDEDKPHIFERFYQTAEATTASDATGTGIGLSLVRDFVTLHDGEVDVFDNIGSGAVFVVHIPVTHTDNLAPADGELANLPHVPDNWRESNGQTADTKRVTTEELTEIMVVDDNEDFRSFMQHSLGLFYRVRLAASGREAWEMLKSDAPLPALVVSDVMMPEMDGNELCRLIKKEQRTQHLPVILLTAKHAETSKVEGLTIGADDYITKPFNMTILQLRIAKLIEIYQSRKQGYIDPSPSDIVITSVDERLIERAVKYIEENMRQAELSVEKLSQAVGLSRVHLYKKLLKITGKTPVEFIRIIRLKRAAQYLRDSGMSVAEIAYAVGINSPRHFSVYFREHFGVTPTEYQEREGNGIS